MTFLRALVAATETSMPRALFWYFYSVEVRVAVKIYHIVFSEGLYSQYLSQRLRTKYGVVCGANARIGRGFKVAHHSGIVIGDGVVIGDDCTIYHEVTLGQRKGCYPSIGNGVTLWAKSSVLGGVTVGDGSQIGACSLVVHDVPPDGVVKARPSI